MTPTSGPSRSASLGALLLCGAALLMRPDHAVAAGLTVWDIYADPPSSAVMDEINKQFMADNPGVTIQRTVRTLPDIKLTLKLAVQSGSGPDVTQVNQGAGDMGEMVRAHEILPLDADIARYGWNSRVTDNELRRNRWSDAGAFGEGRTYGIAVLSEAVGLYENAALLKAAGVSLPLKDFAAFEASLAALKSHGTTPIMFASLDGYAPLHMFAAIMQLQMPAAGRKVMDDLIYGRGGSWKSPEAIKSATIMQDWARKGYLQRGFSGTGFDDATQLYAANKAGYLVSGTWLLGMMKANPAIHFTTLPHMDGVPVPLVEGGTDVAWSITELAKDDAKRALAAKYIDFIMSDRSAALWVGHGFLASKPLDHPDAVKVEPLLGEAIVVLRAAATQNALGHYPDWASPTMGDTLATDLQKLLAGRMTPIEFTDALDVDYQAYLKTLKAAH